VWSGNILAALKAGVGESLVIGKNDQNIGL
jgi:hypothetical protein